MPVGVVVVTYQASEIILDCLESLLASDNSDLRIVVVDNASRDDTVAVIEDWARDPARWTARDDSPFTPHPHGPVRLVEHVPHAGGDEIALIRSAVNTGFAGGVNIGLDLLRADPGIDYFWVLNPDCVVENHTAGTLEDCARNAGPFSLIGGRVYFKTPRHMIQSDGGRINFLTGICTPYNLFRQGPDVPPPASEALDYITGSHMLASRAFLDRTGLMAEDYFLYYEEIDWCCRRGDLPMLFCVEAVVHHDGGHSLGSARADRGPSAMAAYFMGRSRMRFMWRHSPAALPVAYVYSVGKSLKFCLKGQFEAGFALLRGISGLAPPRAVRTRLDP